MRYVEKDRFHTQRSFLSTSLPTPPTAKTRRPLVVAAQNTPTEQSGERVVPAQQRTTDCSYRHAINQRGESEKRPKPENAKHIRLKVSRRGHVTLRELISKQQRGSLFLPPWPGINDTGLGVTTVVDKGGGERGHVPPKIFNHILLLSAWIGRVPNQILFLA